jgi:peroxiredoxin
VICYKGLMKKFYYMFPVMLLLMVMLAAGCSGESSGGQAPVPGKTAPDFQLKSLAGETISIGELRGRPVLLNFWATWCSPCRHEMPFLQEVFEDEDWQKRGLVIVAVNLGETAPAVRQFMEANRLSFTVLLDTEGKVGALYNTAAIPTTFFIDNGGIIRGIQRGAFMQRPDIDRFLLNAMMKAES